MSPTKNSPNIAEKNRCDLCNYRCSKKSDFEKHLLTNKHKNLQYPTLNVANTQNFVCQCGKIYKHSSTLYAHKKSCMSINNLETSVETTVETTVETMVENKVFSYENFEICDLVKYLMKENTELKILMTEQNSKMIEQNSKMIEQQNIVLEIAKNGTHNNSHNTHTNSHNKAFNLNFFLNETCKDAMNIMDFVESIKLQVSDLESVGELGYIEGISNIIVKNLNALDVTQRPVHCTDKKRETIYIKDDDKWEKDEEQKKMHKMIKKVADKNARLLPKFTEKYPDYKNYHSKTSDKYSKIIIEAMGGSGDNDYEKEEKIIKKIAKEILVEK
jgi:hypothetical protein